MKRLRPADLLAGAAGVALLVVMFLPWYQVRGTPAAIAFFQGRGPTPQPAFTRLSAWEAFSVIDILLALCALVAIALVVVTATASGPAKPVAFTVLTTLAGLLATLLALFRAIAPPHGYLERCYGVWVGLAAAVLMLVGGFLTMKDDRTPGAVPPDLPRRPAPPA
jgi:uncharacterized membrane protein